MASMINVCICDDQDFYRSILRQMLENAEDMRVVHEAPHGAALIEYLKSADCRADVVVLDIDMPGKRGTVVLEEIRGFMPDLRVVMHSTWMPFEMVEECMDLGADGCVEKSAEDHEIIAEIRKVFNSEIKPRKIPIKKAHGSSTVLSDFLNRARRFIGGLFEH